MVDPEKAATRRNGTLRALSFDLDGTLLDDSPWQEVILRTCEEIAASHPAFDTGRLVEANAEVWERYFGEVERSWALGVLDGRTVTAEAWRRTLATCGSDDPAMAEFATETYLRNRSGALRLFDDAKELLRRLGPELPLALITNGASDTQREALRGLGIERNFRVIVISGEVGVIKPDPAIFDMTLDRLEVAPENLWHVGDNLHSDVEGAHRAHATAVWLNRRGTNRRPQDPRPDYEVASVRQLPALLAKGR